MAKEKLYSLVLDVDKILEEEQMAVDTYKAYLKITREVICSNKSFTYVISFSFNNRSKDRFETVEEVKASLTENNEFN